MADTCGLEFWVPASMHPVEQWEKFAIKPPFGSLGWGVVIVISGNW